MNSFEQVVAACLESAGFWVKQSVKLDILTEHKKAIGLPSMPRPEIDIVAYQGSENLLYLIEVKSYLDSAGVRLSALTGKDRKGGIKLFTDDIFRKIVSDKLIEEFLKKGLIRKDPIIKYVLVAGKIHSTDAEGIALLFKKNKDWIFYGVDEIKKLIIGLANMGWEDDPVIVTAKIILRNS